MDTYFIVEIFQEKPTKIQRKQTRKRRKEGRPAHREQG
jgi:hypothetical protein